MTNRDAGGRSPDAGTAGEDIRMAKDAVPTVTDARQQPDQTQEFDPFADSTGGLPVTRTGGTGRGRSAARRDGPSVDPNPTALMPRVHQPPRDWVDLVDHWFPERYRVPTLVTAAVSLALTLGFLALPLAGTDLSAQVARGHFFDVYGWHPIDFRWYGGVYPFGYSVLTGPLNAAIGSRGVGAVSCVLSAMAFAWLLARYRVRRPTIGGVLAAVVGVFNLVSGRTTFAMGVAIGMLALVAISLPGVSRRIRCLLGGVFALLAVFGSPVAGLFVGLVGGSLLVAGLRWGRVLVRRAWLRNWLWQPRLPLLVGRYWWEGLALCAGAGLGVLPSVMFSDGGVQPFSPDQMKVYVAVGVAAFFLLPRSSRALRTGAVLTVLLILAVFVTQSPIGSNVTRLPMLYSAPLVAAVATLDRRLLVGAIAVLVWWQPPLVSGDLGNAGDRAAQSAFYQPLIDQLQQRGPVGRVEVVPLYDHWESTYVAEAVPLARGWERQVDNQRNPLFYSGSLPPNTYLTWLYANGVSYVALPKHATLDIHGQPERSLIQSGLPYLNMVWHNGDWELYQVVGSRGGAPGADRMVNGSGVLVKSDATGVMFDTTTSGRLTVRVRWSRWLTLSGASGACFGPNRDGWVNVQVSQPGRYLISSDWHLTQSHRC